MSFAAGLVMITLLASPPVDTWLSGRFWARTAQLIVLVMLAAPFLVLGAPWPRLARLLGRSARGAALGSRRIAILAFACFNGGIIALYIPATYRVTSAGSIRQAALLGIVALGVLFWSQVIAQPPSRCSLGHVERVAYLVLSSVMIRLLGLVLGFASAPFYNTSLFDQQLGAGVLLVPGVFTDLIVLTVCLYMWLGQEQRKQREGFDTGGRPLPVALPASRNEYG